MMKSKQHIYSWFNFYKTIHYYGLMYVVFTYQKSQRIHNKLLTAKTWSIMNGKALTLFTLYILILLNFLPLEDIIL